MSTIEINASLRSDLGKGASRRLRHAEQVPAVVYGAGKEAQALTIEHRIIFKAQEQESFYSQVLNLVIDGENNDVIVKDIQRHPFKPKIMHVDFLRVVAGQEIHTTVPVHFINEEKPVKAGGIVSHHATEIEIACLPKDLPEFIEVDVADLKVGDTLHLSDVKLPAGVSSVELAKGTDHDGAVVTIDKPKGAAADEGDAEEAETDAE
ncbi:50S ribosomal protein L25/general stress protein Ctc [Catenovulum sp. 2E275]|uniref:50S ribosomal protein L25/general stress protein Ctc n=1 Tax=Catenovulum sp. 2E275 TaxID=2980497 RepID=UPI0021D3AF8E|nr:50S ribosomal protein L25/general stress protein Ctc [Catenovulum sp. 2E275]MCU4676616.1 50S ribosomal protein L25/general stress protein Ctc [Catenovulum sp. 2E275]